MFHLQGLFHPARKVREVYWKIYNMLYIGSQVKEHAGQYGMNEASIKEWGVLISGLYRCPVYQGAKSPDWRGSTVVICQVMETF